MGLETAASICHRRKKIQKKELLISLWASAKNIQRSGALPRALPSASLYERIYRPWAGRT
jgi:hypothetical protein